jgi:ABC-2 type transport system ATP-binding protein
MAVAIDTVGLTRAFASGVAVDHLTLQVERGQVLALLGPNGAGKTTTVRLLDGVLTPDSGSARVLGLDPVTQGREVRQRTGVLTENAGLDDRLTARENLEFTARIRGAQPADARRQAGELLERFGLSDRADDRTQGFSTGQRKRVALARALLHDPELLFLDEPTSGLDPSGTREVIALIQSLAAEGRTIVLATHFLGEAGRLATQMAVLHRGRLRAAGRPADLAAELWTGFKVDLDLGAPASPELIAALAALPGVTDAESLADGAVVGVGHRDDLPPLVATLVTHEVPVFGVVARAPNLEDVYFAIEARLEAEEAEHGPLLASVPVSASATGDLLLSGGGDS